MNQKGFAFLPLVMIVSLVVVGAAGYFVFQKITAPHCDLASCQDLEKIGAEVAASRGLFSVDSPNLNSVVFSPILILGFAKADWGIFEGQAGTVHLYDGNGKDLGMAILKVNGDWMQPEVQFSSSLSFTAPANGGTGKLVFKNDNASEDSARDKTYEMPVKFASVPAQMRKINLFYYDKTKDINVSCDPNAVLPVAREIPLTMTPVQDSVNLLLKGILSDEEKLAGFQTEFPLGGFALKGARSENGTLILKFDDLEGRSGGGSCRTRLLWSQISKTVLQFPEVKGVKFEPETLFQP